MAKILLQTTTVDIPDDWNVGRFSLLADEPGACRDDQDTWDISWPNYHSGSNGHYQPVVADHRGADWGLPRMPPRQDGATVVRTDSAGTSCTDGRGTA